jgi:hypothetical protein
MMCLEMAYAGADSLLRSKCLRLGAIATRLEADSCPPPYQSRCHLRPLGTL